MSSTPTVAVIDVGSNSIKLLVARTGETSGKIETVFAETIETRISEGISRELPSLSDQAMAAGLATIIDLVHLARDFRPATTKIVATSAVRDAINGMDFIQKVTEATGLDMRVLSGTEEATYIGKGLRADPQIQALHYFTQMDLGGGSLELIRFAHDRIEQAISLPLGAVRLSEQWISNRDAKLKTKTKQSIRQHVQSTIEAAGFDFQTQTGPMIATGGAVAVTRAILAAKNGLQIDERSAEISLTEIHNLEGELSGLSLNERMATPHLPAARADIFPTALITIATTLELAGYQTLTHSFYNLRYGIADELLRSL